MLRRVVAVMLSFGVGFLVIASATAADDKPADWSAWVVSSTVKGDITKLSRNKTGFFVKTTTPATNPKDKAKTETVEYTFAEGGYVRWAKLPDKLDKDGKKVAYTPAELEELKKPVGVKGFAAARTDLKPGMTVEVVVVRPKDVPAKDVQFSDLRAKSVTIVGENPNAIPKKKGKN